MYEPQNQGVTMKIIKPIQFNRLSQTQTINRVIDNLMSQVDKDMILTVLKERGILDQLPEAEVRQDNIKSIIEAYNNEATWADEYYCTNEDSPLAEYVSDWGYGENVSYGDMVKAIDDEDCLEVIQKLESKLSQDEIMSLVLENCNVSTSDIYINNNEIYGCNVGECEHQPNDELLAQYAALTDNEKKQVQENVSEGYVSDSGWLYIGDDYTRWVSILDVDAFLDVIAETYGIKVA